MTRNVSLATAGVVVAAAAALGVHSHAAPRPDSAAGQAAVAPPQQVFYGHIRTMARQGSRYLVKFDPAWWLTGVTAERANLEDYGSRDVPNDYRIVEEGHRLLTLVVLPSARITVLTRGTEHVQVTAAELKEIVSGRNPRRRQLSQPRAGFWIRIGRQYPNPAVTLDQQYQP
jgi:hypothetical protein